MWVINLYPHVLRVPDGDSGSQHKQSRLLKLVAGVWRPGVVLGVAVANDLWTPGRAGDVEASVKRHSCADPATKLSAETTLELELSWHVSRFPAQITKLLFQYTYTIHRCDNESQTLLICRYVEEPRADHLQEPLSLCDEQSR